MLVGYMRVSMAEQNLALQQDALLSAGIAPERVYEDICSGTVIDRTGLRRRSQVMVDKATTIPHAKAGSLIGRLDDATLAKVSQALGAFLGTR